MGAQGPVEVLSVDACPDPGPKPHPACRLVTGTFRHTAADVLDLSVDGLDAPIGTTATHPFWSEDRQAFIPASDLRQGERLRTHAGDTLRVSTLLPRPGPQPVFNLEIHGQHVYHVSPLGVLVHNACYSPRSRTHAYQHGHAANRLRQMARFPSNNKRYQSRFKPREGGQKFTDEVVNHPQAAMTPQGNRKAYEVDDLGRMVGYDKMGLPTRGGFVVVEGPNPPPWSSFLPDEVVTQYPK